MRKLQDAKPVSIRLFDKFHAWAVQKQTVDGLPVLCDGAKIAKVVAALHLIRDTDPIRYKRILHDLSRVWVRLVLGGAGQFDQATATCELDMRFVENDHTTIEMIAGAIVHEATHARLMRCGIGYQEELRARVESACMARELAFATLLPDGRRIRDWVDHRRENPRDYSDAAFEAHEESGIHSAAVYLGIPAWVENALWVIRRRRSKRIEKRRPRNTD